MLFRDAIDPMRKFDRANLSKEDAEEEENLALGRVVRKDFLNYRVLDRMGLYERRIEQSLYKTMAELQKLRLLHELEENHRQAPLDAATRRSAHSAQY
jgi:hypothetical protein